LFYNRSLCCKNLGQWEAAELDVESALALDPRYFKASFLLGQLKLRKKEYVSSVSRLEKALSLAKQLKLGPSIREVQTSLALARYLWWEQEQEEQGKKEMDSEHYLAGVLSTHTEDSCSQPLFTPSVPSFRPDPVPLDSVDEVKKCKGVGEGDEAEDRGRGATTETPLDVLHRLFSQQRASREGRVIPDWMLDPLTFDLMEEAVVTPHGVSYDLKAIRLWLRQGKNECPVTRKPLTEAQLTPNLALRNAISEWLAQHPWAHPRLPRSAEGKIKRELD
jgi:STIP1 family protein 1